MVEWAPLNVPLRRRLQTLSIFFLVFSGSYGIFFGYILFIALMCTRLWWLMVLYILYALYNNGLVGFYGDSRSEWFQNWSVWKYAAEYFPVKLVKTVDLDPSKNYLALAYPHGLLMVSQWFLGGTNAVNFKKIFPGLTNHIATIAARFAIPFERELMVYGGLCIATEECLLYRLDAKKHKGNFVMINTGASSEIMINSRDEYNLYLTKRRGFARIALKSGASIVPTFSFNENRIFDRVAAPKGTWLRKIQDKFRSITKIALVPPSGRGFFQYSFGMLPHRIPITIVVGAPVEVPKVEEPTKEQIEDVYNRTVQAIKNLFEEHKHKYASDPNVKLNIY